MILPFKAHFLKIIIDKDIYTDFSPGNKNLIIIEQDSFTDVYIKGINEITDKISRYEAIKMVLVEKGEAVFNFENHKKIALYFEAKHQIKIEETEEDILFIE